MLGLDGLLAIMVPLGFSLCVYIHSTAVLLLPLLALSQSSHVEQVPMHRMLTWCTKR